MAKKKDLYQDVDQSEPRKRHKKHKKHKKAKVEYDSSDAIDVVTDVSDIKEQFDDSIQTISAAEKLKSMASGSNINQTIVHTKTTVVTMSTSPPKPPVPKKKRQKGKDSGTSSEEERWLDAIESGKLEEVDDELKKIKDPKLMTARQRAMYERGNDKEPTIPAETLMSLPTGYKEKVMTAEAIQKAQLKSQKRKQLADEKREKDKKKTMERLLKKQDTKIRSLKNRPAKTQIPMISYRNTLSGATVTFPPGFDIPIKAQCEIEGPKPILCAICGNLKKYNCSKTNTPLCSFKCYKQNVDSIKQIIC